MLPQIENQINNNITKIELPSRTYRIDIQENLQSSKIIGFVDNIEAVKQAAYHILATERYAYLIYDENYGVELEQYIGKDLDYFRATIQDTLKEALLMDLRILNVTVTNIIKIDIETVKVEFTITSIYGDLQMEVNVNV